MEVVMKIKDLINEEKVKDILNNVLLVDNLDDLPRYIKALNLNPLSNNESNVSNVDNVGYIVAVEYQKYSQIHEKIKTSEELLTAKQNLKTTLELKNTINQTMKTDSNSTTQDYNQNQVNTNAEWNATKFMDKANQANSSQDQTSEGTTDQQSTNTQDNSYKSAEIVYMSQLQALKVYQANIWKRSIDNVLLQLSNPLDFNEESVKRPWFLTW